jgi:iron complex transport system substrate-binding protein
MRMNSAARGSARPPAVPTRVALCVVALVLAACGRSSGADRAASAGASSPAANRRAAPARIVSLAPSTTETLFALGAGAEVVGVSRFCDFPAEVAGLPRVGGFNDPSLEAVLALRPTLVTGARGPANRGTVERLSAQGIDAYFPLDGSLADVRASIRGLGARVHRPAEAEGLVARLDAQLAAVTAALGAARRPRALLVFGRRPLSVAGPGTFADEMLRAAGAENVVTSGPAYPTIGVERVLALAPEVILEAGMAAGGDADFDWARYPAIPAVRDGRVLRFEDARVLRPGPRVAEGVAVLARLLHPEAQIP